MDEIENTLIYNHGIEAYNRHDFKLAIQLYDSVESHFCKGPEFYNSRGNAKAKAGDFEGSIEDYSKGIAVAPDKSYLYDGRGLSYSELQQFDKAILDFDKAIELEPKNLNWYWNRSQVFIRKDMYPKALSDLAMIIRLDPSSEMAVKNFIFLWKRIIDGNYDFSPENAEEYLLRGQARFYHSEFDEALYDYSKAIELDPELDYAYKSRAFLSHHLRRFDEAEKDLVTATKLKPKCGEYWDDAATNFESKGDVFQAHLCHEHAVNASPDDARLWYNYAVFLVEFLQEADEALKKLDKAIEIWPQFEDALVNRKALLEQINNRNKR